MQNRSGGSDRRSNGQRGSLRGAGWLAAFVSLVVLSAMTVVQPVSAQVPTGSITGTVKDGQGLPVEAAEVTLTNEGTGSVSKTNTSSVGGYSFSSLNFGSYKVSVAKAGFKTGVVEGVKLDASTQYSLPPIVLEVGGTAETVVVEGGAELVQTTSAELTATVEKKQIEDLPILDRNPLALVALEAGVNQNGRTVTVINGQRESFANVTIDGINVQDNFIRTNTLDFLPNLPFTSQAAEFTVTTSNSGPQDGGASAQVSIVTPSGTNNWHGQGFWYYRSNAWAANDWFNAASGGPTPPLLQNQGGGNIGGPIKKDKLFIYGYYELLRLRQSSTRSQNAGVPATILSDNARQGLYTYTPKGGGTPVTVNLLTLENMNVNMQRGGTGQPPAAPVFTIDPFEANLLSRLPAASKATGGAGDGTNTLGFDYIQRNNRTRDNYGFRADYNLNAHNSLTATWSWNRDIVDRPDIDTSFDTTPKVQNNDSIKFLSTAWRWNPTSSFTNEARFGFDLAPAFFKDSRDFSAGFIVTGTIFTNPDTNFFDQGRDTHTWSWQDNASWVRGTHTFKFGGQFQRTTIYNTNLAASLPSLNLGFSTANGFSLKASDFSSSSPIGSTDLTRARSLLATLTGFLTTENQTFQVKSQTSGFVANQPSNRNLRQNDFAIYGGDAWRINRKLTLTYGVRWEYFNPVDERDGLALLPVIPGGQSVAQTILGNATVDFAGGPSKRGLYNPDRNNFGPNIGIAWDPRGNGKMAIRAGYSINYVNDAFFTAAQNAVTGNAGLSSAKTITALNGPTVSAPATIAIPPFHTPPFTFADNLAAVGLAGNAGFAIDPNIKTPYVQQWNLSVQRDIGWNTTVQVSYVGNHGVGLFRGFDVNQVIINQNGFLADFNRARANLFLTGNPGCTTAGCQTLTFFPKLVGGGLLNNATVQSLISSGSVGDLADIYRTNGLIFTDGTDPFAPNSLLRGGDILKNGSSSTWNAGIIEVRRRFSRGLYFQANYVYSKALTDYSGDTNGDQSRFLPLLDNANPRFERSRANFDITHAFKGNFTYELPIGEGHWLASQHKLVNNLIGGWNVGSVITFQTGAPYSIFSDLGILNRSGRSSRETAFTTIPLSQLKNSTGIFIQPNGTVNTTISSLLNGDGTAVGSGDALVCPANSLCNPAPGSQGNIPINFFNGPRFFGMDLAVAKSFKVTEGKRFEFRAEAFNVLNHPVFFVGDQFINGFNNVGTGSNFGESTSTASTPRILQLGLKFIF